MIVSKRQQRRSLLITCVACTLAVLIGHVFLPPFQRLELKVRDQLIVHGRRAELHPDIVFLAIDNASVALDVLMEDELAQSTTLQRMKESGFPWERDIYGQIVERVANTGAKVVALDIMFPSEKPADPPFRAALDRFARQVVIGANIEARDQAEIGGEKGRIRHTPVPPAASLISPPPPGQLFDPRVGFVNFWPDEEDSVVRRIVYRTTREKLADLPPSDGAPEFVSFAARILEQGDRADRIPPGYEARMMRFIDTAKIRPVPLYQIFVPTFWNSPQFNGGEFFRGKLVLIGPDGNWHKDELLTPLGQTNGPRIQISALNAALTGDFLREAPPWVSLLLIFACGGVAWLLGRFLHDPFFRFCVLIAAVGAGYGAAQLAFNLTGALPLVFGPLLALASSGSTFSIVEQILDRREKARMRRTFERYVSRDVVKELVDNPEGWLNTLGGMRKQITVLFSDVRGFTSITENADAVQLVAQLNEYFSEMVRVVFEHTGTIDKFIGDSVMAHWGSIVTAGEKTDACRAVASALGMRRSLAKLNADWKQRGMIELRVGIGVNHGEAIVGNLGSEEKREVSAIGDPVNLAARLEGVTKPYGIDLCIGEAVADLVRDTFILRSLDFILARGKTKASEVFTVLEERANGATDPPWLARHEEAVKHYRSGDFTSAIKCWREVLALFPGDTIAPVFLARCDLLEKHPPGEDWEGIFEMLSE